MSKLKLWAGYGLAAIGFLILLLPGPLGWPGIPPLLLGLMLILSAKPAARRWFVNAARRDKFMLGPFRRWLRKQAGKKFAARTASA
jgi:hypothetical protein